jgi:hypothetical protein
MTFAHHPLSTSVFWDYAEGHVVVFTFDRLKLSEEREVGSKARASFVSRFTNVMKSVVAPQLTIETLADVVPSGEIAE